MGRNIKEQISVGTHEECSLSGCFRVKNTSVILSKAKLFIKLPKGFSRTAWIMNTYAQLMTVIHIAAPNDTE